MNTSVLLRRENKILTGGNAGEKSEAGTEEKNHLETASPDYPSHIQLPNLVTIADTKKCLLAGA